MCTATPAFATAACEDRCWVVRNDGVPSVVANIPSPPCKEEYTDKSNRNGGPGKEEQPVFHLASAALFSQVRAKRKSYCGKGHSSPLSSAMHRDSVDF